MIFYDFETFRYDWLVVLIDTDKGKKSVVVNDSHRLKEFYNKHREDIWAGYNSRHYDQFILKGIICGFDPWDINHHIINKKQSGYTFSSLLNKIFLINYDVMPNPPIGLKTLEGFMGNDIKESDVDFRINRKLTAEEIAETIKYCTHDVEQTMEVFLRRIDDFNAHIQLIKTFGLPLSDMTKTQVQLSAKILECQRKEFNDEFDYPIVDTLRLKKYKFVQEWFENAPTDTIREMKEKGLDPNDEEAYTKYFYSRTLEVDICGVPHLFGWGGLHGAPDHPVHEKGLILHVDVNSFYPSIMIVYDLLSRAVRDKSKYKDIYDFRLKLKAEGKKKEQAPYKIVLNGTYGISKDKYSPAYDPRNANAICVNGQLLLLDLLEHLEGHCQLIQSNTDGLIIKIPDTYEDFDLIDDICYEWESRTGMTLGLDVINEIYQGDVNNYIFEFAERDKKTGEIKYERKGAYVKSLNSLDYDLPIINKALVDYFTKGTLPEKTINDCDDLIEFQKIVKLSNKYDHVKHNDRTYLYKSYRVFASRNRNDGKIFKCRTGSNPAKFGNTPEHCFINNDDINGLKVPSKLDKQWYINLANERLKKKFGIDLGGVA